MYDSQGSVVVSSTGAPLWKNSTISDPLSQPWYTNPGWHGTTTFSVSVNASGVAAGRVVPGEPCANACTRNSFSVRANALVARTLRSQVLVGWDSGLNHTRPWNSVAMQRVVTALATAMRTAGDASTVTGMQFVAADTEAFRGDGADSPNRVAVLSCVSNPRLGACIRAGPDAQFVAYINATVYGLQGFYRMAPNGTFTLRNRLLGSSGPDVPGTGGEWVYSEWSNSTRWYVGPTPWNAAGAALYRSPVAQPVFASGVSKQVGVRNYSGSVTSWAPQQYDGSLTAPPCEDVCSSQSFAVRVATSAAAAVSVLTADFGGMQTKSKADAVAGALLKAYVVA